MVQLPLVGPVELLLLVLFGNGIGIPLGVPPRDPDPLLAQIAPEECLYYGTWAGMAEPRADSTNSTERLLAEPEIRLFARELESVLRRVALTGASQWGPGGAQLGQQIPSLARALLVHPTAIFVEQVTPSTSAIDVRGALVVALGDEAASVRSALTALLRRIPEDQLERREIESVPCVRVRFDDSAPVLTYGFLDDYLIVAVGEGSFQGVVERAKTPPPSWLQESLQSLPVPRLSTLAYINLTLIRNMAMAQAGPQLPAILDTLALSSITHVVNVTGMDETGLVSRTKVFGVTQDRGLLSLLVAPPLEAADLADIPRDASVAGVKRVNVARIFNGLIDLARELDPRLADRVEGSLIQLERRLGIELRALAGALGDVWTVHAEPAGGGLISGWTVTVNVRDRQQLEFAHQKLLQFAVARLTNRQGAPLIRSFVHHGTTVYTLTIPEESVPFAPSWCITDSHLVFTLLPQALKAYLSRPPVTDSLADHPDVAALLTAQPGPSAISFQDTRAHVELVYPWLQYVAQVLAKQLERQGVMVDASALPSLTAIAPHMRPTVIGLCWETDGVELVSRHTLPGANLGTSAPVLMALLLPAVQSSREAARRAQSTNNLKQIGLAMHNYHDVFKALPAAHNVDATGRPLLSWRVHILPFIEQQPLYEQFRLDEPWDSEHNSRLIPLMPPVYRSPLSQTEEGKTVYLGNAGPDGVFQSPVAGPSRDKFPRGTEFRQITDGLSNTIMAVEASDQSAIIWTKPDDLTPDPENPLRGLVGARPGGFLVLLCDGSVRILQPDIDHRVLKALFTAAGGEVVSFPDR